MQGKKGDLYVAMSFKGVFGNSWLKLLDYFTLSFCRINHFIQERKICLLVSYNFFIS